MKILQATVEVFGIVLFRFRLIPCLWAIVLITINLASLVFIDTIYGQVALSAVSLGLIVIIFLYSKFGFVRLLGIGHAFWIPMIYWLVAEMPFNDNQGYLITWIWCLITVNSISLVIDAIDVTRYFRGERNPHHSWN